MRRARLRLQMAVADITALLRRESEMGTATKDMNRIRRLGAPMRLAQHRRQEILRTHSCVQWSPAAMMRSTCCSRRLTIQLIGIPPAQMRQDMSILTHNRERVLSNLDGSRTRPQKT